MAAVAAVLGGMLGIGTAVAVTAPAQAAVSGFVCSADIYTVSGSGAINRVNPVTGAATGNGGFTVTPGNLVNALAIPDGGGQYAWAFDRTSAQVLRFDAATETTTTYGTGVTDGAQVVAGAIDPTTGIYYFASSSAVWNLYAFDTTTGTMIGQVGTISGLAGNGDMAFDAVGNLYVVSNANTIAAGTFARVDGPIPTTPGTTAFVANPITATPANAGQYNSVAVVSDGSIAIGSGSTITRVRPENGATLSQTTTAAPFVDFASCAYPNLVYAQKNLPNGRYLPTDQFRLQITSPNVTNEYIGITEGTDSGLQDLPSETAGPVLGVDGVTFTVTETGVGTTDLANYVTTWECVNRTTGAVLSSGSGAIATFTLPSSSEPAEMYCTFTNIAQLPALTLQKRVLEVIDVNGNGITDLGDQILWAFDLTNTGNTTLSDLTVDDDMLTAQGIGVTCDPDSLPVGGTVTCEADAAYTITQADVDNGKVVNTATATGTPPTQPPVTTPPSTTETPVDQQPALTLDKRVVRVIDVNDNGYNDEGDQIVWAFDLENTGTTTLTDVSVTDDMLTAQGIGVTCDPTTLAPGATVTCEADAPYTITAADVDNGKVVNTATATGTPPGLPPVVTPPDTTETPVGAYTVVKTSDPASGSTVGIGDTVTYTLTVSHVGTADVLDAHLTDDLSAVLDDATFNDDATASAGTVDVDPATGELTWSGDLGEGDVVTITYSVTVTDDGDSQLTNVVTSPGCTDSCTTENPVGDYSVVKSSDPASGSSVAAGDVITYTLTVTHEGRADVAAQLSDDLSGVLDDATYNADAVASSGSLVVDEASGTLTWSGDLSEGDVVTITYSVTVTGAGDTTLENVVTSPGCAESCTTEHYTGDYTVVKSSDPASGATVAAGQTITYTLTVTQHGAGTVTAALSDDLSAVLDDATFNDDAQADLGEVSVDGSLLAWSGTLEPGEVATITYSVTVTAAGDRMLTNVVTSPGCTDSCTTEHGVGGYVFSKSSNPKSGSTVANGSTITYTVTVRHTGIAPVPGANVVDDLSRVLDDATWSGDQKASSGTLTKTGSTLSWTGDLAVGQVVTITYSVKVTGAGDRDIANLVTTDDIGGSCDPTGSCTTDHRVPPPTGLAITGGSIAWTVVAAGGVALLIGAGLLIASRRRRRETVDEQD
ncbi:hypothetical protein ACI3KS_11395 [Microbacterium sp. ZW T5_45]|uniref:DUF7927 domain-containing protein n=1 Tax=Microbacterium sp. ZW T5_45 TaxID=3378080 RepID=UPI003853F1EA